MTSFRHPARVSSRDRIRTYLLIIYKPPPVSRGDYSQPTQGSCIHPAALHPIFYGWFAFIGLSLGSVREKDSLDVRDAHWRRPVASYCSHSNFKPHPHTLPPPAVVSCVSKQHASK